MSNRTQHPTTTIEAKALRTALAAVAGAVARSTTIPILSHVRLDVGPGYDGRPVLAVTGTDLEREIRTTAPVDALSGTWSTTVPAHLLTDIVKRLPEGGDVALTRDDGNLVVACGRVRAVLRTLPVEDFPAFADRGSDDDIECDIPADDLGALLSTCQPAISREETRYYLNGVFLHVVKDVLRAVATDGHRLIQCDRDLPEGAEDWPEKGIIVPRDTVPQIIAMCQESKGETIGIEVSPSRVVLTTAHRRLASKLIDGTFPDYSRVIPTDTPRTTVLVEVADLAAGVGRVATVGSRGAGVRCTITHGGIALAMSGVEGHAIDDSVDADVTGADVVIGFNPAYFVAAAEAVTDERVMLALGDPGAPARLTAEDSRTLAVVMPMRVS